MLQSGDTLKERQKLFTEVLPKWEGRIRSVSAFTIQTKPIDRSLLDVSDIANLLRWYVWKAVECWDEARGASLSSWIFYAINQGRSLIVESQYHKIPRDVEGNTQFPLSIDADLEVNPEEDAIPGIQIEDKTAFDNVVAFIDKEEFDKCAALARIALSNELEQQIFDMVIGGEYRNDQAIADELGEDFAKVGDVRFKVKIAFALLNDLPLESFTKAKNSQQMAALIRKRLSQYL